MTDVERETMASPRDTAPKQKITRKWDTTSNLYGIQSHKRRWLRA